MPQFPIEELTGIQINPVEGVRAAPQDLRGFSLARAGGYVPFGSPTSSVAQLGTAANPLIAYDEAALVLLTGESNAVALVNLETKVDLTGSAFVAQSSLSLAPRSAILTPWTRGSSGEYIGGAWFLDPATDTLTRGPGAGTATITPTVGTGTTFAAGIYEFIWVVEHPTEAGLAVAAVGDDSHELVAAADSFEIVLSEVYPSNTVIRFYYRPSTEEAYERFSVAVSNGIAAPEATLDTAGTFVPTEEALVNFAPGRLEAHNRRIWGMATAQPFTQFRPTSLIDRTDAYMLITGGSTETLRQSTTIASGDMLLRASGNYVEVDIQRIQVERTSSSTPVVVELFSNRKTASTDHDLFGWLEWPTDATAPTLYVMVADGATADDAVYLLAKSISLSGLALSTAVGSSLSASSVTIRVTLGTYTNSAGDILGSTDWSVSVGDSEESGTYNVNGAVYEITSREASFYSSTTPKATRLEIVLYDPGTLSTTRTVTTTAESSEGVGYLTDADTPVSTYFEMKTTQGPYASDAEAQAAITTHTFYASLGSLHTVYSSAVSTQKVSPASTTETVTYRYYNGSSWTTFTPGTHDPPLSMSKISVTVRYDPTVATSGNTEYITRIFYTYLRSESGDSYATWSAYTTAAETTFALGRLPAAHAPTVPGGNREARVQALTGTGAGGTAIADVDDYASGLTWTGTGTLAQTWNTSDEAYMVVNYDVDVLTDENPVTNPNTTLIYSDTGSVSRGKTGNFLPVSPLSSSRMTALASTPAGLLIFMDRETFLLRGDPGDGTMPSIMRFSGSIGNDAGVIPGRMGNVVLPIYRGEIHVLNVGGGDVDFGGTSANLSKPVWLPDDPFVQVVGEPLRNQVVARTSSGRLFRFDWEKQEWFTDPLDGEDGLAHILPSRVSLDYGVRYVYADTTYAIDSSEPGVPSVKWEGLDFGDKNLMKLYRRVEFFTNEDNTSQPQLEYWTRGQNGTMDGEPMGQGRWVFTFPRGIVGTTLSMEISFPAADYSVVVEPPVVIEYQPRYRQR